VFVAQPGADGREHLAGDVIWQGGSDEGSYPASWRSDGLAARTDAVGPRESPRDSSESASSTKVQRVLAELQQARRCAWIGRCNRPKRVQEQKRRFIIAVDRATEYPKKLCQDLLVGGEVERPIHNLACERAYLVSGKNLALFGWSVDVAGRDKRGPYRRVGEGERRAA
jgi:hypothetical protein